MSVFRIMLATSFFAASLAHAGMPALPEIPTLLPDNVRQALIAKRQPLALRKLALVEEGNAINSTCANVVKDSSQHQRCLSQQSQFNGKVETLRLEMDKLADEIDMAIAAERSRIIKSMNTLAKHLGWNAAEQTRLDKALNNLATDGDPATSDQIIHAWNDVLARGQGSDVARAAAQGDGPGFPGAGTQTQYQDCAIFALANAAGLPYSVVAARATKLISEGEWRDATARANPQNIIEQQGLIGGEMVMLAEAFGEVEVVPSTAFAKTLKEGRPVMVNVVPQDGNVNSAHEVVLSKTFQHHGETWYEMMDSNQGAQRRFYVNTKELHTILQENGVAFRPDPETTPKLFR